MFKSFALLFAAFGVARAALPDFIPTLNDVTFDLSDSTASTEAVKFMYSYTGPTDAQVSMEFKIYSTDCTTLYASDNNAEGFAIYKNALNMDGTAQTVDVDVALNLATIEASLAWTDVSATTAAIAFCGRLEMYYGDGISYTKVLVNYHETNVAAQLTLTEDGGFNLDSLTYDLVEADETEDLTNAVQVDYDVSVWKCDAAGAPDATLTTVNQGVPIHVCVNYQGSAPDVFVESIYEFKYWSVQAVDGLVPTTEIISVAAGTNNDLATQIDCNAVAELCIISFLVDGSKFLNQAQAMKLQISGLAVIAVRLQLHQSLTFYATNARYSHSSQLLSLNSSVMNVVWLTLET